MGARRFNIHETVSTADEAVLARLAAEVSRNYFRTECPIDVLWGIPSASEASEPKPNLGSLNPTQLQDLESAIRAFHSGDYSSARDMLKPFVDIRHVEASKLYVKTLQKLRAPDWDQVAKQINRVSTDTLYVAAGSTEMRDGKAVILIHQNLSSSLGQSAPKSVLRYVIHHEFLHIHLGTCAEDPHPQLFRRFDKCFPGRAKAIAWLQAHNYSTIEDAMQ
ncbi:hypothetical protein ACSVIJ_04785 [Pseudomonas sp. NCHU5208]|uniref:hypothetical protein n=1 Tax=unclassified Pseudomonas TaxID=196821 RepID=UPI003F95B26B